MLRTGRLKHHADFNVHSMSFTTEELAEAVRVVREGGAAGVSLFEMDGLSDEHVAALRAALA